MKILQQILTAMATVTSSKAAYQKSIVASDTLATQNRDLLVDLKQVLQAECIGNPDLQADYGLVARKSTVVTPKVKAAAADKALATRAARHTMSAKAKKKITGATVAPAASPEPTAPTGTTPSSTPTTVTPVVTTPGH